MNMRYIKLVLLYFVGEGIICFVTQIMAASFYVRHIDMSFFFLIMQDAFHKNAVILKVWQISALLTPRVRRRNLTKSKVYYFYCKLLTPLKTYVVR